MYLKLYQIWGIERMVDLRSQEDVWIHLVDLWRTVKQSEVMRLEDNVKTEICSLINREGEEGAELLAETLVNDDLLVPDTEFLESVDGGTVDNDEVKVPDQLVQIWSDFIHIFNSE